VNQDKVKREKEHQELYWFTLPQELHQVSLPTSKEIHSGAPSSSNAITNTLEPCRIVPLNPTKNSRIV